MQVNEVDFLTTQAVKYSMENSLEHPEPYGPVIDSEHSHEQQEFAFLA